MLSQRIDWLHLRTDALTLTANGGIPASGKRPVTIRVEGDQTGRLPRFADLPVISASRAEGGASFGGWSASIRLAIGDGVEGPGNRAYWISLVNEGKEPKAICGFVGVTVRVLVAEKAIKTVKKRTFDVKECDREQWLGRGWRLVEPGKAFTFLLPIESKTADARVHRVAFTLQGVESSAKLELPYSAFSIEAMVDAGPRQGPPHQ